MVRASVLFFPLCFYFILTREGLEDVSPSRRSHVDEDSGSGAQRGAVERLTGECQRPRLYWPGDLLSLLYRYRVIWVYGGHSGICILASISPPAAAVSHSRQVHTQR